MSDLGKELTKIDIVIDEKLKNLEKAYSSSEISNVFMAEFELNRSLHQKTHLILSEIAEKLNKMGEKPSFWSKIKGIFK